MGNLGCAGLAAGRAVFCLKLIGLQVIMVKVPKRKISITLDEAVLEGIKTKAKEDDRSFSQYINIVLRNFLHAQSQAAEEENG